MNRFASRLVVVAVLLAAAIAVQSQAQPANILLNPANWTRMAVDRFGCMLERELGYRDDKFNCALKAYSNKATPCNDPETFYEGPVFPTSRAPRVAPALSNIEIAYQAGQVRAVTLLLKERLSEAQIRQQLGLPAANALPQHVKAIRFDGCRGDGASQQCNVVLIEGFEHQGADDVDCGGDGATPEPTETPKRD